jgi:hypothetical protein
MRSKTGTGKYEKLLIRCRSLEPIPTAIAHPCEAHALAGGSEAATPHTVRPRQQESLNSCVRGRQSC